MNESKISLMADFILEVKALSANTHYAEDRSIYEKFLSQAALILAKLIKDEPIGNDINGMERLFGNTWLKNDTSYSRAYSCWDRFKELLVK